MDTIDVLALMAENTNQTVLNQIELITENAALRAMLKRVEFCFETVDNEGYQVTVCPVCYSSRTDGHDADCELAALLEDK